MRALTLVALLICGAAWASPRAEQLLHAGRIEEALVAATEEARAAPDDVEAQELLVDLRLTLGLGPVAVHHARQAVAAAPADPDTQYLLARAVPTAEEARAAYERALRLDPDHARSHMGMGAVHRAQGDMAEAQAAYQRALDRDPTLGEAWAGLLSAHIAQGEPQRALEAARAGTRAAPEEAGPWLAVAMLAPDEAVEALRAATVVAGHDPRVHSALAVELLHAGEAGEARRAALSALTIDPSMVEASRSVLFADAMQAGSLDTAGFRDLMAAQHLEDDDPAAARSRYDDLVGRHPRAAVVWMARARVRAASGDDDAGAEGDLVRALELTPTMVEAQAALGMLLHRTGRDGAAFPLLRAATAARPRDASLGIAAAEAQAAGGDREGALTRMEGVLSRSPHEPRAVLALAKLRSEGGDLQGAYDVLKEAVGRLPDGRLVLGLAAAARDIGRYEEAAALLDQAGRETGNPAFHETAERLREYAREQRQGP